MTTPMIYEIIGYAASALVAISLMMSSVLKLRIINLAGAAAFTVYGLLIAAYPVAAVNLLIVGINLWHLSRMRPQHEYFRLLEIGPDDDYLRYFLEVHAEDIRRFQPHFRRPSGDGAVCLFVLRDLVPAGLLVGRMTDEATLRVDSDYVIPGYRDFEIGKFLFEDRAAWFRERGIERVVSPAGSREHADYLERMGFEPAEANEAGERLYTREVG